MVAIRKLKISFDVDIDVLTRVLAENNSGFNIEAYQTATEPKPRQIEATPLLLEDNSEHSLRELVVARLRHTGKNTPRSDLAIMAGNNGFSHKQLGNILYILKSLGVILNPKMGVYRISKRHM